MELIKSIKIEGLRSIQKQDLSNIGSLNVFVGRNSSGKSNALRALNLFFNGYIEPGKAINFVRDHYERSPRRKIKKRIAVSICFNVPDNFRLRKGLESLDRLGKEFTITRSWELDQFRRPVESLVVHVDGKLLKDGEDLGKQFLTLITYRYIPNRTVPSDILRDESQAIANSIFGRMKGDQHASALLSSLTDAAKRMLEDASKSLSNTGSPLTEPSVSTDADVLSHVANISGLSHLRFVSLPNLDANERRGGKDKIFSFLKNSHGLVKNRSREAPFMVLLDWEVSSEDIRKTRQAYDNNGELYVDKMSEVLCNNLMSADFKGIERFYPPDIVKASHDAGEIILGIQGEKPYSISSDQLSRGKAALRDRILQIKSSDKLKELLDVVKEVDAIYRKASAAVL